MGTSGDKGGVARKVAIGNPNEQEYEHKHEGYYGSRFLVLDRS